MFALRRARVSLVLAALLGAACTSSVDVKEAIDVTGSSAGWYDAGIVDGKNKIVPSVTFRLQKNAEADVDAVSLNVVFRHPPADGGNTEEDWDEVFVQNVRFSEGNQTPPIVVRPEKGYTGDPPQSRLDLLKHSQFRDVRARVFAKYSSTQWAEVGVIDIPRELITR
jgi:hypothetical protein